MAGGGMGRDFTLTLALSLRERGSVDIFAYPCEPVEGEGTYAIV